MTLPEKNVMEKRGCVTTDFSRKEREESIKFAKIKYLLIRALRSL